MLPWRSQPISLISLSPAHPSTYARARAKMRNRGLYLPDIPHTYVRVPVVCACVARARSLLLWALHCEDAMGKWASALLMEEAERARHDAETGACSSTGDEQGPGKSSAGTLSQRKSEAPAQEKGDRGLGGEEEEILGEGDEGDNGQYVCRELSCEQVEMISTWREQAMFARRQALASWIAVCPVCERESEGERGREKGRKCAREGGREEATSACTSTHEGAGLGVVVFALVLTRVCTCP
jgi:hypothetical protein